MSEDWPLESFERELAAADRLVVLYYADWCPYSRSFLPLFEDAEHEASVPFARANLHHPGDARWDAHRVAVIPTVAYYEHGEELERCAGVRREGLSKRRFTAFLDDVESLQDQWRMRHGRVQLDRFG